MNDADMRRFSREIEERLERRPDLAVCVFGENKPYYNIYGDFLVAYFDKDEDEAFLEFVSRARADKRPLMAIVESKRYKEFMENTLFEGLDLRKDEMQGDPITILETPPREKWD